MAAYYCPNCGTRHFTSLFFCPCGRRPGYAPADAKFAADDDRQSAATPTTKGDDLS